MNIPLTRRDRLAKRADAVVTRADCRIEARGIAVAVCGVDADYFVCLVEFCWPEDTLVAALVASGGEDEDVVCAGGAERIEDRV